MIGHSMRGLPHEIHRGYVTGMNGGASQGRTHHFIGRSIIIDTSWITWCANWIGVPVEYHWVECVLPLSRLRTSRT